MSQPVPGCPCVGCRNAHLTGHELLMLAEAFVGTSFTMPSGQMCEMMTDKWKQSPMCPWMRKSPTMNVTLGEALQGESAPAKREYTEADVIKLTELLLAQQKRGAFSGSMHDLATKLLKGLHDDSK